MSEQEMETTRGGGIYGKGGGTLRQRRKEKGHYNRRMNAADGLGEGKTSALYFF